MEPFAVSSVPYIAGNSPRACTTCVRAKAKCVPGIDSQGKCQRCHRLQKSCEPPASRAKSDPRKRKASAAPRGSKARVEKLEEKLDDLVTLLKSSKQIEVPLTISPPQTVTQSIAATSKSPTSNANASGSSASHTVDDWDERLHIGGPIRKRFALPNDTGPLNFPHSLGSTPSNFQVEPITFAFQTPDELLNIFRNEMASNLPFITIAAELSAEDLRKARPSLYTAVMAIANRDSAKQRELGKLLVQQIAERIHMHQERTMDLLLAILTYAGWSTHHFYSIPTLTGLLTSAQALVADLGINRPGAKADPGPFKNALLTSCGITLRDSVRTLEERRAALGCWYLIASVSTFFHRLENAPWTPYLEECCEVLRDSGVNPRDSCAVGLVRIQLLAERIAHSPWHAKQNDTGAFGICAPPALYLKAIETHIDELRKDLCTVEHYNAPIRLGLEHIRILLYKIGLSKSTPLSALSNSDFNRMELLFKCVQAAKSFFQTFLEIPPDAYHTLTVPMYTQVTANLGILQLMATYDHPEWDLAWLRRNIWFSDVLRDMEKKYESAKFTLGFDRHTTEGIDIYSQTAIMMAWIRSHFEGRSGDSNSCADSTLTNPPNVEFLDLDDAWMRDILLPWEFQPET